MDDFYKNTKSTGGYIQHVISVMSVSDNASDKAQASKMQKELDDLCAALAEMIDLAQVSYLESEDIPKINAAKELVKLPVHPPPR